MMKKSQGQRMHLFVRQTGITIKSQIRDWKTIGVSLIICREWVFWSNKWRKGMFFPYFMVVGISPLPVCTQDWAYREGM